MPTHHSYPDLMLSHLDNALKTLTPGAIKAARPLPTESQNTELRSADKRHITGLMRINHCGEVCAQGLYKGQALTARTINIADSMNIAASEELDHLAWCETRLKELKGRTSLLNPFFYACSYTLGALAGAAGDKTSLGFVAATEDQVSSHLSDHLQQIGQQDPRSRDILTTMLQDEQRHSTHAIAQGGTVFPKPVKTIMSRIAKLMTTVAYRL